MSTAAVQRLLEQRGIRYALIGAVGFAAREYPRSTYAKYRWQREVLHRSEPMTVDGSLVLVPRLADLLLLKLFAGGYEDRMDIHRVLAGPQRESLIIEVESRLHDLPADARALWIEIVSTP